MSAFSSDRHAEASCLRQYSFLLKGRKNPTTTLKKRVSAPWGEKTFSKAPFHFLQHFRDSLKTLSTGLGIQPDPPRPRFSSEGRGQRGSARPGVPVRAEGTSSCSSRPLRGEAHLRPPAQGPALPAGRRTPTQRKRHAWEDEAAPPPTHPPPFPCPEEERGGSRSPPAAAAQFLPHPPEGRDTRGKRKRHLRSRRGGEPGKQRRQQQAGRQAGRGTPAAEPCRARPGPPPARPPRPGQSLTLLEELQTQSHGRHKGGAEGTGETGWGGGGWGARGGGARPGLAWLPRRGGRVVPSGRRTGRGLGPRRLLCGRGQEEGGDARRPPPHSPRPPAAHGCAPRAGPRLKPPPRPARHRPAPRRRGPAPRHSHGRARSRASLLRAPRSPVSGREQGGRARLKP